VLDRGHLQWSAVRRLLHSTSSSATMTIQTRFRSSPTAHDVLVSLSSLASLGGLSCSACCGGRSTAAGPSVGGRSTRNQAARGNCELALCSWRQVSGAPTVKYLDFISDRSSGPESVRQGVLFVAAATSSIWKYRYIYN
jgi:hypothetical protein